MIRSIVLLLSLVLSVKTDWCSLTCDNYGQIEQNTMCALTSQTNINGCTNIKSSITPEKRKKILTLHNEYRNKMASGQISGWPAATNMRIMTWDPDLERVAQRWADQCISGHDKCRRTAAFEKVGQNYGMAGSSASTPDALEKSFQGWVDEISLTSPSGLSSFQPSSAGHFTQVIWAESYKLGCGEITYEKSGFFSAAIVCNYADAGNFIGQSIYKEGAQCGSCPQGTKCDMPTYTALCGTESDKSDTIIAGSGNDAPRTRIISLIAILFSIRGII